MANKFAFAAFLISTMLVMESPATGREIFSGSIAEILAPEGSSRANLVCPFNVINGPKAIGTVIIGCYAAPDTTCNTSPIATTAWGGNGGTPTLNNGSHSLSNDAMDSNGLTGFPTTVNIQLQVHNSGNSASSLLCMSATIVDGVFTCTGGPYTLDINNL